MSRKFIYISAFLVALVGIVPLFIDFSNYARPYIKDAEKTINRTISTGSIRLQILPTPRLKIHDVILSNAPNASKPEMVKVKSVEVILSLFDLLKGKIVVKSVDLKTPEITLEKAKNGTANWELNIASSESEHESKKTTAKPTNAAAAGIVVSHIDISNATVTYIDHKEGSTKTFSNLNIECDSETLMGPYKVHVRTDSNENNIDIAMLTGAINLSGKTALKADISVSHKTQKVHINLDGAVDISREQFLGKLKASSADCPLTVELPHQKIDLRKPVDMQGDIQATAEQVTVKNLRISHAIGQLTGMLSYNISSQLFDADLKFKHEVDSINLQCSTKDFSEFEYHIYSEYYQDILKWFTQDQTLKNKIDIKGSFKAEDDLLVFKKTAIQLGDANADASIQYNTTTKQAKATVQLQSIQQWGQLLGHSVPFSGPSVIALKLVPNKENMDVSAKVSLGKGNMLFDGSLGQGDLFAKGNLTLEHINLNDYVVNLESTVLVKKTEIDLTLKKIELKDQAGLDLFAGGKLIIDLSKEKPHIAGSITAQPIQLTSYQGDAVYLRRALYTPETIRYQFLQIAANANSRWSSAPIKLPLHAFTMNLQINVPKITLGGLVFEALQSDISLKAGKLGIPFSAHMYGGKLSGALQVESASDQSIGLAVKFDNIAIEKIQAAAAHFSSGKASGEIDLKTRGNSQYDWVSKLKGQANFSVKDGIVKGFDLSAITNLLKKPSNLLDLKNLQNCFSGSGQTAFSNAGGKFTIVDGVATTNNLIVEATDAQLKAEGQADLLNWQMRFTGEVLAPTLKNVPPIKFTIKGPIDQPNYNLDLKQLQQLFLQKGAGDLVSKTLGKAIPGLDKLIPGLGKKSKGDASPQASNSNAPEDNAPVKADKVVKGLLKGIFG
jgi:uncharacterized protein involved in outer membrane biogenesis